MRRMRRSAEIVAVEKLRDAFDRVIDLHEQLNIDPAAFEAAKQEIIGEIIDACPESDPGTYIELADGRWTLLQRIRQHPDAYVRAADGRWTVRAAANVVALSR